MPYVGDSGLVVPFERLRISDLQLEAVYLGGNHKNVRDDPLDPLVPGVGNQGGFRYVGSPGKKTVQVSVLYTSGVEVDWPDSLDPQAKLAKCISLAVLAEALQRPRLCRRRINLKPLVIFAWVVEFERPAQRGVGLDSLSRGNRAFTVCDHRR